MTNSDIFVTTLVWLRMLAKVPNKIFQKWFVLPILAIVTFGLTEIGARNPDFTEKVYSRSIYPVLAYIISNLSNPFPFSLDDMFYLLLIISVITLVVLLITKRISWKYLARLVLNVLAMVYVLFYFLWGFNYYREDLNTRLQLKEQMPDTDDFLKQLENLIDDTNKSYSSFENMEKEIIDSLVEDSYKKLAKALAIKYPAGKRKDKSITWSSFFAKAGISGYFGPFFNEIHVNKKVLPIEYPSVLAHEKAHQFGITSEAEANFYAWIVCTQSSSKQLQYSANLHILRYFLHQGYQLEEYPEIISKLDVRVKDDYQRIRENWMNLRNEKVDRVASKVNDSYLKSNKVDKGIKDYTGVVKHVMNFSLDSAFQKRHNLPVK